MARPRTRCSASLARRTRRSGTGVRLAAIVHFSSRARRHSTGWRRRAAPGKQKGRRNCALLETETVRLVCHAGLAASGHQAHPFPGTEFFVSFLGDRAHLAVVQPHGDLDTLFLGDVALDGRARHPADHRAEDRAYARALAATDVAAGDATHGSPRERADLAPRSLDRDLAHRFRHAHSHRLLASGLARGVDGPGTRDRKSTRLNSSHVEI